MKQKLPIFDPLDLSDEDGYLRWREKKLANYPDDISEMIVEVKNLADPSAAERTAVLDRLAKCNATIYVTPASENENGSIRTAIQSFSAAFGLHRMEQHRSASDDGIVAIEVATDSGRKGYIPYSNKPLSWHTDGYYNAPASRIRAFLLHCVHDAAEGGETEIMDPEVAYIRLRDENPDFIAAMTREDAMTIPPNIENGKITRPESVGPVFSSDAETGRLHMRFTARSRNIEWHKDAETEAAVRFLIDLLKNGDPLIFKHKLAPGQGLICRNILHRRAGFTNAPDSEPAHHRLLYRARYLDEITAPAIAS